MNSTYQDYTHHHRQMPLRRRTLYIRCPRYTTLSDYSHPLRLLGRCTSRASTNPTFRGTSLYPKIANSSGPALQICYEICHKSKFHASKEVLLTLLPTNFTSFATHLFGHTPLLFISERNRTTHALTSNLVLSKMRLEPSRTTSMTQDKPKKGSQIALPRFLTTIAVLIGVRAGKFVSEQLKLPISKTVVWTDSQGVLHWLTTCKPLSVFVQNRVAEIRQHSTTTFSYIPTLQNPADLPTRGCTVSQIQASSLWWHGPSWLQRPEHTWPKWNLPTIASDILESVKQETRGPTLLHTNTVVAVIPATEERPSPTNSPLSIDESKYSSLRKLFRVTSYALKFLRGQVWYRLPETTKSRICQKRKLLATVLDGSLGSLNATDIRKARLLWDYSVQQRRFQDIINAIHTGRKHNLQR